MVFGSAERLGKHSTTHGAVWACVDCSFTAPSSQELSRHRSKQHTDKWRCKYCSINYSDKYVLKRHLRNIHNLLWTRDYICRLCKPAPEFLDEEDLA
jgi:DNA-directed RNA polymerase subunit RPC12/RpoP